MLHQYRTARALLAPFSCKDRGCWDVCPNKVPDGVIRHWFFGVDFGAISGIIMPALQGLNKPLCISRLTADVISLFPFRNKGLIDFAHLEKNDSRFTLTIATVSETISSLALHEAECPLSSNRVLARNIGFTADDVRKFHELAWEQRSLCRLSRRVVWPQDSPSPLRVRIPAPWRGLSFSPGLSLP
jgi:hypothetical protein